MKYRPSWLTSEMARAYLAHEGHWPGWFYDLLVEIAGGDEEVAREVQNYRARIDSFADAQHPDVGPA